MKCIFALLEVQAIVKGKPEASWGTLGCLWWSWTRGNRHQIETGKIMIRY